MILGVKSCVSLLFSCKGMRNLRHGRSDEEQENSKVDGFGVYELVVDTITDGSAGAKGNSQTKDADCYTSLGIHSKDAKVRFETDEEEEEDQTNVCDQREIGNGDGREDCVCKARDAPHDGRSEYDTSDDFANDLRGYI